MEEKEAKQIVAAYAACQLVDGCKMCPLYNEERDLRSRGYAKKRLH